MRLPWNSAKYETGTFVLEHQHPQGVSPPSAHLVEVIQQICGILIHPIRARPLELVEAITSGKQADPQRLAAPRGEHVPDAVADCNGARDRSIQPGRRGQKQVRVRLRILHVIACDHHVNVGIHTVDAVDEVPSRSKMNTGLMVIGSLTKGKSTLGKA